MKMLIFPLKKEWYEKIKSGEKAIEYREVKPYWIKRIGRVISSNAITLYNRMTKVVFKTPQVCFLQLGYNPATRLKADITEIEIINGKDTDLHIDKKVYAIHLSNVREVEE